MPSELRELERADPFQPHDHGCHCWPHVSQRAAIEAAVQAATAEYRDSHSGVPVEGLDEALERLDEAIRTAGILRTESVHIDAPVARTLRSALAAARREASEPLLPDCGDGNHRLDSQDDGSLRCHVCGLVLPWLAEAREPLGAAVETFIDLHDEDDGAGWPCDGNCASVRELRMLRGLAPREAKAPGET